MPDSSRPIKLGRYAIRGQIAIGGMATVYRASLSQTGGFERDFALKVIHPHLTKAEGFLERFYDEARIASRIRHPNVVSTVGFEQANGRSFLVLELIDGVTLRQLQLERDRALPAAEAARIIADAARGLHAVHTVADDEGETLDAIHRDISPHNLMIDSSGRALLIDLGLVKARGQLGHTQTGVLAGKLPYMSPEQSMLQPLDARSDVFSLGSVLFELLTGELPFGDDHSPSTLDRLRACDRTDIAQRLEKLLIPRWISSVVLACLHADRDSRFPTALALAEGLEDELRQQSAREPELRRWLATHARTTMEKLGPLAPVDPEDLGAEVVHDRWRGWVWGATAVAAAGIAAFLGAAAIQGGAPSEPEAPAGSMAVDASEGTTEQSPAEAVEVPPPTRATAREAAPTRSSTTDEEVGTVEATDGEPAPKRKRLPAPESTEPELKENPYTSQ